LISEPLTTPKRFVKEAFALVAVCLAAVHTPAQGQDFGWSTIPGTVLTDACPDSGLFDYNFSAKCQNVVYAWGGAAFDDTSGQMYIWGGGHTDYYGNEVYALDVHRKSLQRLTDPAPPANPRSKPAQSQLAPYNGTQPNSRHTYDGLAFIESHRVLWAFSGGLAGEIGPFLDNKTWLFHPDDKLWRLDNARGDLPSASNSVVSAYDPVTEKVFLHDRKALYSYSYSPNGGTYHRLNSKGGSGLGVNAAIDPKNRRMMIIGNGQQTLFDLTANSGYRRISAPLKGDADFIKKHDAPGLAYNSNDGHLYAWPGDGKLYRFHMDTLRWEGIAINGDPGPQARRGTFGRFDFVSSINSFVLLNDPRKDAFLFQLPTHRDTQAPTAPRQLVATHPYPGSLAVNWQASTDNFGVAGYRVFINDEEVNVTDSTRFKSMAYSQGESISIQVQAFDSAGQDSPRSAKLKVVIPKAKPQMRLGDCTSEPRLAGRNDLVFCEPWENEQWKTSHHWLRDPIVDDPRPMTKTSGKYTKVIDKGCVSGKCLQVNMEKGKTGALSAYWPLANANLAPERLFMRYYFKLGDDWDVNMCKNNGDVAGAGGKFPGLADLRTWADPGGQCGNGGASGDGINCWSMRLNFSKCKGDVCNEKPDTAMRLGSYNYFPLQKGSTGTVGFWDGGWNQSHAGECDARPGSLYCGKGTGGIFERGQWYQIEMQVEMNTPGRADGVIRGWIDGQLSYEKTNMVFRKEGHDFLHNRLAWFNIYKGGLNGNCTSSQVYLDQMVIALDQPVGGVDTPTPTPPEMTFTAQPRTPGQDEPVTLQWSSTLTEQCKAAGLWSGDKALAGSQTIGPLTRSGTVRLSCSGPGGKVVRQLELLVDGEAIDADAPLVTLTAPTGLRIAERSDSHLKLTWNPSPKQENIVAYRLLTENAVKDEVEGTTALVRNLLPGVTLRYRLQAVDKKGNLSAPSKLLKVSIPERTGNRNQATLYPDSDTYLAKSTFKTLGASPRLSLSRARNVLLKFPVEMLGQRQRVKSATLILHPEEQYGDAEVALYHVASDWHERSANRDYIDTGSKRRWQEQLGDWVGATGAVNSGAPSKRFHISDTGATKPIKINVTSLVNAWLAGTPNHGVMLVQLNGATQNLFSKDDDNASHWPRLNLRY